MEYFELLNSAYDDMKEAFNKGRFSPYREADLQAFIYHSLISKGIPAKSVHLEVPVKPLERKRWDLVLGNMDSDSDKKLYVEIKQTALSTRNIPSGWKKDIKRIIEKTEDGEDSTFVLFLAKWRGKDRKPYERIEDEKLKNEKAKGRIKELESKIAGKEVKLIPSIEEWKRITNLD